MEKKESGFFQNQEIPRESYEVEKDVADWMNSKIKEEMDRLHKLKVKCIIAPVKNTGIITQKNGKILNRLVSL